MGPGRLVAAFRHPDDFIHQRGIGGIGICRTIPEAKEIAGAFMASVRLWRQDRY